MSAKFLCYIRSIKSYLMITNDNWHLNFQEKLQMGYDNALPEAMYDIQLKCLVHILRAHDQSS